jgi:hypothetical protein
MTNNGSTYTLGFNHGYLLAKYAPVLYGLIQKPALSLSEYGDGFEAGAKEWEYELSINKLSQLREKDKGKDFER